MYQVSMIKNELHSSEDPRCTTTTYQMLHPYLVLQL